MKIIKIIILFITVSFSYCSKIKFEYDALSYLNLFIRKKDYKSIDMDSYNFNFYKDEEIGDDDYQGVMSLLLKYSDKFYNYDNDTKVNLIQNHKESYKYMIQLLVSGFLNKWYLTETNSFKDSDVYMRNGLLFCLEILLDVDIDFNIGNISIKELLNTINTLSSSLYYDDTIVSYNMYLNDNDIINAPAYSAIGRGHDNNDDYGIYVNILKDYNAGDIVSYRCPYSFDHKISLMMLGICNYNKYMLQNTNKYNLIYLYMSGKPSFVKSNRFIYSFQNAFQYYNYAGSVIFNRSRFKSIYPLSKNYDMESIVNELFTPYDIETILYALHKYDNSILPDEIYYLNEYNSMSKNAVSLFNAYSDIMEVVYNLMIVNPNITNEEIESENIDNNELENNTIYNIANILFDLYYNIEDISSDIDNYEKVIEYNNIVGMFNNMFSKSIYELGYYEYTGSLDLEKYPQYYPENQLAQELAILSKYYDKPIEIDTKGQVTIRTSKILSNILNKYQYKNYDLFDLDEKSKINGISQMEYFLDFSAIVNNKLVTNYYGDYYSDNIMNYVIIVNSITENNNYTNIYDPDDIETSGNSKYMESNYSFEYITDTIDSPFMIYNINYIVNHTYDISLKSIKLIFIHYNHLKCTFNDNFYFMDVLSIERITNFKDFIFLIIFTTITTFIKLSKIQSNSNFFVLLYLE